MAYGTDKLYTAGKITVYTTIVGVFAFAVIFLFNLGNTVDNQVSAQQNATTSVTVLNTGPQWTVDAREVEESSTTSPTDAGRKVTWEAIGTDSNSEDYWLLICSDNASPTPNVNAPPTCDPGATQWAVSASTTSGTFATVSTTTTASSSPFAGEEFEWYAWICDGNTGTPRCVDQPTQGSNATNSSPFNVNHRPSFTTYYDSSPADPGVLVTFTSTSSDPDNDTGTADTVRLFVCAAAGFSTSTNDCTGNTLASTSPPGAAADATATYTIVIPTQDQDYQAFGYVIDNHGFEASGGAQGTDSTLTVNNVAPTISSSTIFLNGDVDMVLTNAATQTPSFKISYTADDNNSCENSVGGDEVTDRELSVYRSGVGSTTCTTAAGDYDPNNCYPSELSTAVWNLQCTASTTDCVDPTTDTGLEFTCTFPLWYIADPTDGTATTTEYPTESWLTQIQAIDDDAAAGPLTEVDSGVEVTSFLAFSLNQLSIPYGSLEPGQQTDPLVATTTLAATGNIGLDKDVQGTSMCTTYTGATPCPNSSTSTINANEQRYATTVAAYAAATALSSTTAQEVEVNVPKSTATNTQATSSAYWGINVPGAITFSGDYFGENTITAITGESSDW